HAVFLEPRRVEPAAAGLAVLGEGERGQAEHQAESDHPEATTIHLEAPFAKHSFAAHATCGARGVLERQRFASDEDDDVLLKGVAEAGSLPPPGRVSLRRVDG